MQVLNFGSLNLDYVYSVPHFVRPGEAVSSLGRKIFCGGKGLNQSIAAARAGVKIHHAGKIGKNGGRLLEYLRDSGVDTEYILEDGKEETGHTVIQVDPSGQNGILVYGGTNAAITAEEMDGVFRHFHAGDFLLLQNEINGIPEIMEKAHRKKMQIAFNPSPVKKGLRDYPLEYVKWFFVNEIEGAEITGKKEPEDIAGELLRRYPGCSVILTLGKRGVYYRDAAMTAKHGVYQVNLVDTTGAGDTFTGYFLAGLVENWGVEETLRRASVASSLSVSRAGAAASIPTLAEVLSARLEPEN